MKLLIDISGENGVQDCTVTAEGSMLDVCKMFITAAMELYSDIEEKNGAEAAYRFRETLYSALDERFFRDVLAAYKRDIAESMTAVPMAAPGYIRVPTQK